MFRLPALAVLACAGAASAEPEPPGREHEPAPAVPIGRRLSPRSDAVLASYTATRGAELTTWDVRVKAGVPVVRGDGYGAGLLAGYGATGLDLAMAGRDEHLTLHRFEATLGGGAGVAPGWSLRGSFGVAQSSDLQDATWSAMQLTSSAMVHRVLGPSDAVIAGLVYTSSAEFLPVLPILGYVHQREGSPFRFDAFLPHHVRAEYELGRRVRGALGIETGGNTWVIQAAQAQLRARRAGGSLFGELELAATELVRFQARAGLSVDRYTLPVQLGGSDDPPLRAAAFAQLAVVLVP